MMFSVRIDSQRMMTMQAMQPPSLNVFANATRQMHFCVRLMFMNFDLQSSIDCVSFDRQISENKICA